MPTEDKPTGFLNAINTLIPTLDKHSWSAVGKLLLIVAIGGGSAATAYSIYSVMNKLDPNKPEAAEFIRSIRGVPSPSGMKKPADDCAGEVVDGIFRSEC